MLPFRRVVRISIHPPRVGRDLTSAPSFRRSLIFQSTLPVWGGTKDAGRLVRELEISIHPPRVGRDVTPICFTCFPSISIHPPHVGRDAVSRGYRHRNIISIHPPRVGRDRTGLRASQAGSDFNPPSPCGEGRVRRELAAEQREFQSTLPVWGGTCER